MFVLSEQTHIVNSVLFEYAQVALLFFQFLNKLLERLAIRLVSEPVFDVNLSKKRYHILSLVFRGVNLLNPVKNYHHDDLVGHNSRLLHKVFVTFLNAFYRIFQHMLWLRVYTNTYCQFHPTLRSSFEQR